MRCRLFTFACAAVFAAPAIAVEFEPSINYWMSEGKTTWNHNAQPSSPTFGNPTSRLTYSGMKSRVAEIGLAVRDQDFFGRASFGTGTIDGGNLEDEDFFVGQFRFSDTNSTIRGDKLEYWMFDFGGYPLRSEHAGLGLLVGYGEYREVIDAFGATGTSIFGPVNISQSTKVITNDAKWTFVRVGLTGQLTFWQRLTFLGEAAFLPWVDLVNEDSHYLRGDLGPVPNIHMKGAGTGTMWQLEARVTVYKGATLSLAYRDWRFKADGTIRFGASGTSLPLNSFETTRSGARVGFSYRF